MAGFIVDDVVVVPFPFSDLSESKRHPALVLAESDLLLCQTTSKNAKNGYSVENGSQDFVRF